MSTTVEDFLKAELKDRFEMALDPAQAPAIRDYLGAKEFARYVELARAYEEHLAGVEFAPNLVFVPGVMGSLLHSRGLGGVWWIDARTREHIEDLRLADDGRDDFEPNNQIEPFSIDTSYEPFLAHVLASPDFNHRFFAYDWRKPLRHSAADLLALVERVYERNGEKPVHLVGHSMGGLMIRAALMEHGDALWPMVDKVCFVGTPHYGSPAIASYLKHHFWGVDMLIVLRKYLSRAAFRSLWGVMELLPAPVGIYPGTRNGGEHPCGNFDFYDVDAWKLDLTPAEAQRLAAVLHGAAGFHRALYEHHRTLDPELRARMAVIAGVGIQTLFRLEYRTGVGKLWKEMNKVTERTPGDPDRDGDGRVPLASALLEDVSVRYVRGKHGELPNIPAVADDVLQWLRGHDRQLPDTGEEALSTHLSVDVGAVDGDDPGFLHPQEDEPDAELLDSLDGQVEAGERPDFVFTRLL
jgi:pimeloyl-ACP methyl ester carboxylesterase